jgi:hypothetical protein
MDSALSAEASIPPKWSVQSVLSGPSGAQASEMYIMAAGSVVGGLSKHLSCRMQAVITSANLTSLPPIETTSASIGRPAAKSTAASICAGSLGPVAGGSAPAYSPSRPFQIVAPEHARWMNVTEVCGSASSRISAACTWPDNAERWQRRFCQRGPRSSWPPRCPRSRR